MADAAPKTVLVCTVGGSPQPVASALRDLRPDAVVFVCSDGAGATSSRTQVEEREIVYDTRTGALGPGLRRVEGCPEETQTLLVPADDPDRTYALCLTILSQLKRSDPRIRLIADYTGGTKSMTGGLLMAAFATEGCAVQFMLGHRPDLVQVAPGTEAAKRMSADLIQAERDFDAARQAVAAFDYAAAQRIVEAIGKRIAGGEIKPPGAFRNRLKFARRWSALMAQWDAFQHGEAARMAFDAHEGGDPLADALHASGHCDFLQTVASREAAPSWELCADLWLNAQRRAARGRYDDALARLYRLVEAAAQAQLMARYGLDSGRIPPDALPEAMRGEMPLRQDPKTHAPFVELAQNNAYRLLGLRDPSDPVLRAYAPDWRAGEKLFGPAWLSRRNKSILAHGYKSIREEQWRESSRWVEGRLRPFWSAFEPPQLPTLMPEC